MKIVHPSGQPYDLPANFKLEMSRTNPFFHKTGEQSLPCSLPPSRRNMDLLGHPYVMANRNKIPSRLDVSIETESFFIKARQAILNAKKNEPIQTSFYLNESAFYEKIKNLTLAGIFKDKSIQFSNVDVAISFVWSLMSQHDDRFSCFSVSSDGVFLNDVDNVNTNRFRNSIDRTIIVDEKEIRVPKGMFITPFIKVWHVLSEVATYLGYTLDGSFLDIEPFRSMVFLNNNTDTIMLGRIDYVDIVPDMTLEEFFNLLRKFNCEVLPDETNKKLKPVLFNDIDSSGSVDIAKQLIGEFSIDYHDNYKQLRLTSQILNAPVPDNYTLFPGYTPNAVNEFTNLLELSQAFPSGRINTDGSIYRIGYKGEKEVKERVGSLHCNYFAGDKLPEEEKTFPDILPEIQASLFVKQASEGGGIIGFFDILYPYVGKNRSLRTKLIFDDDDNEDLKAADHQKLAPILCFYFYDSALGFNVGTIHNYDFSGQKLWNYTLAYNGVDGIYEKFWRKYDNLLRNALLEIRGEFLLTETQKMMLSSHKNVIIDSQNLIPSEIKYIPGENIPRECTFLTTKLQHPVSEAKYPEEYFKDHQYKWILKTERNFINTVPPSAFESIEYKTAPAAYFPNNPTQAQYNAGGKYYQRQYEVEYGYIIFPSYTKRGDGIITTWLEPSLV